MVHKNWLIPHGIHFITPWNDMVLPKAHRNLSLPSPVVVLGLILLTALQTVIVLTILRWHSLLPCFLWLWICLNFFQISTDGLRQFPLKAEALCSLCRLLILSLCPGSLVPSSVRAGGWSLVSIGHGDLHVDASHGLGLLLNLRLKVIPSVCWCWQRRKRLTFQLIIFSVQKTSCYNCNPVYNSSPWMYLYPFQFKMLPF